MTAPRRALLGGLLAGGAGAVALAAPAAAGSSSPQIVKASGLKKGDLVVGPGGSVVRVATTGRRPNYTDPTSGKALPLPKSAQFVVLMRNVPASAIPVGGTSTTSVIDGGNP